ncbi:MAG TPA: histidine kinase [Gammaproteobacteria bacterium]|nr:histidine kinase [Gammaproteobacteria bacterium]
MNNGLSKSLIVGAAIFLLVLAGLHFTAVTLSAMRANNAFTADLRVPFLFAVYYLSWIGVFIANFYILTRYLPVYGNRFLVILFIAGLFIWIPCATIIDGKLSDAVFNTGLGSGSTVGILFKVDPITYFTKFLVYCYVFGAIAVLVYYRMYQGARIQILEREKEAAEAKTLEVQQKLTSLQLQLAPHFLFNCLNMLSALARMGKRDELVFVIARLGDMLRFVYEASQRNTITLAEEIDFVETYVKLQQARFADKYNFNMTVSGEPTKAKCPPFCVHTLVENAYTHSTVDDEQNTEIAVRIEIGESRVRITVGNNNPAKIDSKKLGVSLANLNDRLKLLYADRYRLDSAGDDGSYTAQMEFPHESED